MSNETVTKTYQSVDVLRNVKDDLINSGALTQEQVYLDKEKLQVKVIVPNIEESEIMEIMGRHNPID